METITTDELAENLTSLVRHCESLLSLAEKLEKSPVIDKAFSHDLATLAALSLASARQAARVACA